MLILPLEASLRLEESRIEREWRDLHNLDRHSGCETVIDEHIAIRRICDLHDHRRYEKQNFCSRIEPCISDALPVGL